MMPIPRLIRSLLVGIVILSSVAFGVVSYAATALPTAPVTPTFMFSWNASSYVPQFYVGRILPNDTSAINISFNLIENQKIVDLIKQNVQWYMNNTLYKEGLGLISVTVPPELTEPPSATVRIDLPNYKKSKIPLSTTITIPITTPFLVIDAPYPDRKIQLGTSLFRAQPYFIDSGSLAMLEPTWMINNVIATSSPTESAADKNTLSLTVKKTVQNMNLVISASVTDSLRTQKGSLNLFVQ